MNSSKDLLHSIFEVICFRTIEYLTYKVTSGFQCFDTEQQGTVTQILLQVNIHSDIDRCSYNGSTVIGSFKTSRICHPKTGSG